MIASIAILIPADNLRITTVVYVVNFSLFKN